VAQLDAISDTGHTRDRTASQIVANIPVVDRFFGCLDPGWLGFYLVINSPFCFRPIAAIPGEGYQQEAD